MSFPDHYGVNFTKTTHEKAEGPTLPENNKPPAGQHFNVVVTGAGKGLGYAISIAYAKAGATGICISSRTQSDLDALSTDLKRINPNLTILSQRCDTSDPKSVAALATATTETFGTHLDVVVANAGIISKYIENEVNPKTGKVQARRLPEGVIEDEDYLRVTSVNYLGVYYTAKYFVPGLVGRQNQSSIRAFIAITSLAGHFPVSTFTPIAYNVSKIAVNRLIECMANDHAADSLLAFSVHPGEVITPQTEGHSNESGDDWEKLLQTDVGLVGGFCTWLTHTRKEWLSGRYLSVHWDVNELEAKKEEIVEKDALKFRMVV
ncbi:hypothetical protein LTS08_001871 [Lithohypha guttulata]|uniref:NAD(P)-binding protein n=1 Tax=Lithohypha guttulata TaxID=1690604 RepID=A0AAN7Y4E5_9EURO|nr:hypothetical protein LTR51_003445 [Lithohypha guttulata]KAK5081950.1 hypothetical protein LTR05_007092 [Lithohypha guttulata]KAK5105594.1 hypothetical protein LTS08_001871 [Lithohypha guttulata]